MNFKDGIEKILNLHLPNGETIKDIVSQYSKDFDKNRKAIIEGEIPKGPVKLAISFICSRSGRWPYLFHKAKDQMRNRTPMSLLKERELNSFLDSVYTQHGSGYRLAKHKISQFLKALQTLAKLLKMWDKSERFEKFEEEFEEILEEKAKIGRKGVDNILRDCGYLMRIPIDIHERRFLLRTGIFHKYTLPKESDPEDYNHLAKAMRNFCKEELSALKFGGVSLSDAPGLFDLIIWYFSQEKTEKDISLAICAKIPQCERCPLRYLCLFARLLSGSSNFSLFHRTM